VTTMEFECMQRTCVVAFRFVQRQTAAGASDEAFSARIAGLKASH
jgi:hypothetical protein